MRIYAVISFVANSVDLLLLIVMIVMRIILCIVLLCLCSAASSLGRGFIFFFLTLWELYYVVGVGLCYVCMYVCMYVCVFVCRYVCVCMCVFLPSFQMHNTKKHSKEKIMLLHILIVFMMRLFYVFFVFPHEH